MTTNAASDHAGMIKARIGKKRRDMTVFTVIRASHMRWVFTFRGNAIVAALTGADNGSMVHSDQVFPSASRVAILTFT